MGFQADRFDLQVSRRILPKCQLPGFSIGLGVLRVGQTAPILSRVIVTRVFSEVTLSAEVAVCDIERGVDIRLVVADPTV